LKLIPILRDELELVLVLVLVLAQTSPFLPRQLFS
jgi:hypothetical protein